MISRDRSANHQRTDDVAKESSLPRMLMQGGNMLNNAKNMNKSSKSFHKQDITAISSTAQYKAPDPAGLSARHQSHTTLTKSGNTSQSHALLKGAHHNSGMLDSQHHLNKSENQVLAGPVGMSNSRPSEYHQ